jgi:hypothetical protein
MKNVSKILTILLAAAMIMAMGTVNLSAEAALPENATNVALEKEVYAEVDTENYPNDVADLGNTWFNVLNLVDGENPEVPTANIPADLPICWYGASKGRDTDIFITIDLDGTFDVYQVIIYPSDFLKGANMPSTYEVLLSTDADNWEKIGEENGISEAQKQYFDPFVYSTNQKASYVGIHITRSSAVADPNYAYSGISEIEVMGVEIPKTPKPTSEPTAEPTEAPATDAPVDQPTAVPGEATKVPEEATKAPGGDDTTKGPNTGLIIGIVCGVVVIAAVVAGIIIAKKKGKK